MQFIRYIFVLEKTLLLLTGNLHLDLTLHSELLMANTNSVFVKLVILF